jgi:hypothetical protein
MTNSTAVATIQTNEVQSFELMQREAKLFSNSPLIPDHLRKGGPEQAMANCYIALKMAKTMGEDPLVVLQNIHIVSGKAGFASQYMIARANSSGVFKGRINWRVEHRGTDKLAVTAFAYLADSSEEVAFTCDLPMARAEGWTKNPKYNSMPEVMLRYRSAAFLVRFYAPDVMLGYHTADEWEDVAAAGRAGPVIDAQPRISSAMLAQQAGETVEQAEAMPVAADPVQDAEIEPVAEQHEDEAPGALSEAAQETLDAIDGPLDEPEPDADQADEIDPFSPDAPWAAKVAEIKAAMDKAETVIDLQAVPQRFAADLEVMPQEVRDMLTRQASALKDALKRKAGQ